MKSKNIIRKRLAWSLHYRRNNLRKKSANDLSYIWDQGALSELQDIIKILKEEELI